jgi:hypothetical protein
VWGGCAAAARRAARARLSQGLGGAQQQPGDQLGEQGIAAQQQQQAAEQAAAEASQQQWQQVATQRTQAGAGGPGAGQAGRPQGHGIGGAGGYRWQAHGEQGREGKEGTATGQGIHRAGGETRQGQQDEIGGGHGGSVILRGESIQLAVRSPGLALCGGQRAGIEKALQAGAAVEAQESGLAFVLHAFGHHMQAQLLGHGQDAAHQGYRVLAVGQAGDELAIDLDAVEGETLQIGQ